MTAAPHRYLIGLGSNRWHGRHGPPPLVIAAALAALAEAGVRVERASPTVTSAAMGPSRRRYANAAALVATRLGPGAVLALAKRIERDFGRRGGRRWGARVLDIDLLLWSGGRMTGRCLTLPHPGLRARSFALGPAAAIAPRWRDPRDGRPLAAAAAALQRGKVLDPRAGRP